MCTSGGISIFFRERGTGGTEKGCMGVKREPRDTKGCIQSGGRLGASQSHTHQHTHMEGFQVVFNRGELGGWRRDAWGCRGRLETQKGAFKVEGG